MRPVSFVLLALVATVLTADLYAQPRLTVAPVALTTSGDYAAATYSPDGSTLVFTTPRFAGLYALDLDAEETAPRTLTDAEGVGYGYAWAPDGGAIAARTSEQQGVRRLHRAVVYTLAEGPPTFLTPARDHMATLPVWSADGAAVLVPGDDRAEQFASGRPPLVGKVAAPEVVLAGTRLALAQPGVDALRDVHPFEDGLVVDLAASPDGQRVAFKRYGDGVYVMNRDGSGLVRLGEGEEPTWSPDGRWVAVQRSTDDGYVFTGSDLYLLRADGGETVRLTETPDALEMRPAFAPSGDALVYDDRGTIYRVGLDLR